MTALIQEIPDSCVVATANQPLSPDKGPSNYFLFPNLKKLLDGTRFEFKDEITSQTKGSQEILIFGKNQKIWDTLAEVYDAQKRTDYSRSLEPINSPLFQKKRQYNFMATSHSVIVANLKCLLPRNLSNVNMGITSICLQLTNTPMRCTRLK